MRQMTSRSIGNRLERLMHTADTIVVETKTGCEDVARRGQASEPDRARARSVWGRRATRGDEPRAAARASRNAREPRDGSGSVAACLVATRGVILRRSSFADRGGAHDAEAAQIAGPHAVGGDRPTRVPGQRLTQRDVRPAPDATGRPRRRHSIAPGREGHTRRHRRGATHRASRVFPKGSLQKTLAPNDEHYRWFKRQGVGCRLP